jgi:hypothetical protein
VAVSRKPWDNGPNSGRQTRISRKGAETAKENSGALRDSNSLVPDVPRYARLRL